MEIARKSIPLGENTFYVRRYEPFLGVEILGDLQAQFAGPFMNTINGKPSGSEEERNAEMMAALGKLSKSMDGKAIRTLAEKLVDPEYVSVEVGRGGETQKANKIAFALAAQNGMTSADLLQLCWEIVVYNYAEVVSRVTSPTGPAGRFLKANPLANSIQNS